jgi:hypothetical protein
MADYQEYDPELDPPADSGTYQPDTTSDSDSQDTPSALPVRTRSRKNLVPYSKNAPDVSVDDLSNFDFKSLVPKPPAKPASAAQKGTWDRIKDAAGTVASSVAGGVSDDIHAVGDKVRHLISGEPDMGVMGKPLAPELQKAPPAAAQPPVRPGLRRAMEAAYDSATPEQRVRMANAPGAMGDIARQREAIYGESQGLPSQNALDPSAEARTSRMISGGMAGDTAQNWGRGAAARGDIPGDEVGQATPSNFDFETARKFKEEPLWSHPLMRAAVKGVEGYKQGVIGVAEWMADLTGQDGAGRDLAKMNADSQAKTDAIGESPFYAQRMFEGAVSSIAQQLPMIGAGVVTGSEALPLAGMFVQSYGQNYAESRAAGQDVSTATDRAGLMAALEVIGEKFGLHDQMHGIKAAAGGDVEKAINLMVKAGIKEVPGEELTTTGQFGVDISSVGLHKEQTLKDLAEQIRDTAVQTMIQSGMMTAGTHALGTAANKLAPADGAVPPTTREPQGDIRAQIRAMMDPKNPKDAVFIAKGTPVDEADIPDDVIRVDREEGTLLTTNPRKANTFNHEDVLTDRTMANILGIPEDKGQAVGTGQETVIQATDKDGNVVNEAVDGGSGANAQAVGATVPEGGALQALTPEEAQRRRALLAQQENVVPGEDDSEQVKKLLEGVQTVDEDGNPVQPPAQQEQTPPQQQAPAEQTPPEQQPAAEQPPAQTPEQAPEQQPPVENPPQQPAPPEQTPPQEQTPPEEQKPQLPDRAPLTPEERDKARKAYEEQTKARRALLKPKTPEAKQTLSQRRVAFGQAIGAEINEGGTLLRGADSRPLSDALRQGSVRSVIHALTKSKNHISRVIGHMLAKDPTIALSIDDKLIDKRVGPTRNKNIDDARRWVGTLDAVRAVRRTMENYSGAGLPTAVLRHVVVPAGALHSVKSAVTLGKMLRQHGVTNRAQFMKFAEAMEQAAVGHEKAARANASANHVQNPQTVQGLYDHDGHAVRMRASRASDELVVTHEITHALTVAAIMHPNEMQKPYVQKLEKLFAYVRSHPLLSGQYGLVNLREFIAEGFGNPEFQFRLSEIPYESDTAWGKFTKMIASLLGMKHSTAFTEMMALGEGIMSNNTVKEQRSMADKQKAAKEKAAKKGKQASTPHLSESVDELHRQKDEVAGDRFKLPKETRSRYLQAALQDNFNRVNQVQRAVQQQGGTVDSGSDIYAAHERFSGQAAAKTGWFTKYTVKPLIRDMGRAGVDINDLALYMYARHAAERNKRIADINGRFPDGGSGMTNAEAANLLQMFAQHPKAAQIKAYAARFDQIIKDTQKVMIDGGLVDPNVVAAWNAGYQHYVPLKGFEKLDELGTKQIGAGRGFDVRGTESIRALGRESKAGQILENIIMDHERAIVRAEKNKVARALLKFVRQNPDDKLWDVNRVVLKPYFQKSGLPPTPGQLLDGEVRYRNEKMKDPARTVTAKVNGQEYHIMINDPRMLEQLVGEKGALNMEGASGKFFRAWSAINRTLTKLWTAWNPVFTVTNFTRDFLTAAINGGSELGPAFAAKVAAYSFQAIGPIARHDMASNDIQLAANRGSHNIPKTWRELYKQYQEDGGKAGFYVFAELEDKQRELERAWKQAERMNTVSMRAMAGKAMDAIHLLDEAITDLNSGFENATRVAAYRAALEMGKSRAEAASIAKNLTVNFNRRGTLSPMLGSFYLFFNPSVQGLARMARAAKRSPKTFGVLTAGLVATGLMAAWMGAGDKDEDGVPYWDKTVPDYEKQKNLIFMMGGGNRLTIPLAYGYGWFVHLGYGLMDAMRGRSPTAVALELANSAMNHFSPVNIDIGGNLVTAITPTLAGPMVEHWTNIKSTGQPLRPPAQRMDGTPVPDSERYWSGTRDSAGERVTTFLNEATGGNSSAPGLISVSPEVAKNYVKGYLGGAGSFVYDLVNTTQLGMTEGWEEVANQNAAPGIKQFFKRNANSKGEQRFFMEHSKEALQALDEFKHYYDSEDPALQAKFERNDGLIQLGAAVSGIARATSDLRKMDLAAISDTSLSDAERKAARKEIDDQRAELWRKWNNEFYKNDWGIKSDK